MSKNAQEPVRIRQAKVEVLMVQGLQPEQILEELTTGKKPEHTLLRAKDPRRIIRDDIRAIRRRYQLLQDEGLLEGERELVKARLGRMAAILVGIMERNATRKPILTIMASTRAHMIVKDLAKLAGIQFDKTTDGELPEEIDVTINASGQVEVEERKRRQVN